jgi:hypothetical protein
MRYGTNTRLEPKIVLKKAEDYFGALGLKLSSKEENGISWDGPVGYVTIRIYPGEESEVDINTVEWDSQVKKFLQRVG